ncbi:MAG: radical SAM protein [Chthonomonadales bacterium]|nr:radical SAM protein [Chthonomonadales bacterium]
MLNYENPGRVWHVYVKPLLRYATPRKAWNALRTEWAYRCRRDDVRTLPYILHVEPVYHCNLHCPLCERELHPDPRPKPARRLSLDLYERVLDELGDYLFQCHIFGLGEPLIDWPLTREVIERTHRRRIFTLVSTNCTLVTPRMADEIAASSLDYLVCAIDGVTQASYGAYRVGGRVEVALRNLWLLADARRRQRSRLEIEWQFLVNAHNVSEIPRARAMAREMGVRLRLAPMRGMEWEPALERKWLPHAPEWGHMRQDPDAPRHGWHCYWLWRGAVVRSDGELARCPVYQNLGRMGNLADRSVMSLYNGESSRRARQLFRRGPVAPGDFPLPCRNCNQYRREHGGAYRARSGVIALTAREATEEEDRTRDGASP